MAGLLGPGEQRYDTTACFVIGIPRATASAVLGSPLGRFGTCVAEAVRTLDDAAGPLTLQEIAASVENRIGGKIDKPVISGALQALEAEFNDATGEWRLSRPSADDDEDTAELSDDASLHARHLSV